MERSSEGERMQLTCAIRGRSRSRARGLLFCLGASALRLGRLIVWRAALCWMIGASASAAAPQSRLALVIGNGAYASSPLALPLANARRFAERLRHSGFATDVKENQSTPELRRAIAEFKTKISAASAALIFYSGYAIQSGGENYLIPVDASIWSEADVRAQGVSIESILADMAAKGATVKIAVIDASRRTPFERNFRNFSTGLEAFHLPVGSLAISAASPGKVIGGNEGQTSIFIQDLLEAMAAPGLSADDVFNRTRVSVSQATNSEQVPWVASSLTETFYFDPVAGKVDPAARKADPAARKDEQSDSGIFLPRLPDQDEESERKAPKPQPATGACTAKIGEADGIVTVEINDPARASTAARVAVGDWTFGGTFDSQGRLKLEAPLLSETAEVAWTDANGGPCQHSVRFSHFAQALEAAIVWSEPIDIKLHVVEPGAAFGAAAGYLAAEQPNRTLQNGFGVLRQFGSELAGTVRAQSYALPIGQERVKAQSASLYVGFASRGNPAKPPYCGNSDQATAHYTLVTLRYGNVASRKLGFAPRECGYVFQGLSEYQKHDLVF